MPSLAPYYNKYNTEKQSLNAHLRRQGIDPKVIWNQIQEIGSRVLKDREENFIQPKLMNSGVPKALWR